MSDIIEKAKDCFESAKTGWGNIYTKAKEDLQFLSDDPHAQWDSEDYNARVKTGRPALTIDQLSQFIHQVANDIRMNTPAISVVPSDIEASQDVADILKGQIREIEYYSNSDDIYDTASLNSIRCGIGFIRVDFEFEKKSFNQRLCLRRVVNPLSVWIDPMSIECDGSDAKYGFVLDEYTVKDFKKRWPKKTPSCFKGGANSSFVNDDDTIFIAEYFMIDEETVRIKNEDGSLTRDDIAKTVRRYVLSGEDVLEESTFPGEYVPIVPVYGEEAWIDGKRYLFSLIRKSKGAQQMYNYWKSLETELLMKAPNAPVMAAEGQTENYADDWKNPSKSMVLRYKTTDVEGNPVAMPQRLEPPTIPTGVVNASRAAVEDIKSSVGIYNAGLGQRSNETSGIAIQRRQQEGDVATFHFQDNLVRSITQVGRILASAIPEIYSGERIVRTIGTEDDIQNIGVNGALVEGQEKSFDLTQGRYEAKVKTGGSYTTRRQEAADFLTNLVNASPEFMQIMGDLMFENMDFAGSNVMAERMKKFVDPKYLSQDSNDPRIAAFQEQMQQAQKIIEGLQAQLQGKEAELRLKAQAEFNDHKEEMMKIQIKQLEFELKAQKQQSEIIQKEMGLLLKEQEVSLKEEELQLEAEQGRAVAINGQI